MLLEPSVDCSEIGFEPFPCRSTRPVESQPRAPNASSCLSPLSPAPMLTLNLDERSDVPSGGTEGVVIRVAFPFSSRLPVLVLLGSMHHSLAKRSNPDRNSSDLFCSDLSCPPSRIESRRAHARLWIEGRCSTRRLRFNASRLRFNASRLLSAFHPRAGT
jgi:hypothetical protein